MIKKLICFLWGHKTVVKAYTGNTIPSYNALGMSAPSMAYTLKRLPYCKRCGRDVNHEVAA